jgi:hypothetical protein
VICSRVLGPPPTRARSRVERLGRKSSHPCEYLSQLVGQVAKFRYVPTWPETPTDSNINGVSVSVGSLWAEKSHVYALRASGCVTRAGWLVQSERPHQSQPQRGMIARKKNASFSMRDRRGCTDGMGMDEGDAGVGFLVCFCLGLDG